MSILNLTRKVLPLVVSDKSINQANVRKIPEMILHGLAKNSSKNIVPVSMNRCAAARVTPNGVHTIFTDGLNGCNAVGLVAKGKDGLPIAILSHYTPLQKSRELQLAAWAKQLETYRPYIDTRVKPNIFYNIPAETAQNNSSVNQMNELFNKWFGKGFVSKTIPYEKGTSPFSSRAAIFQFDPADLNKVKFTAVGEQERLLNLSV
ncbi:MAG: hypothetical protein PHX18_08670 [Candidatus Gastranaerophilales bacterium]|nr:hypothetical protein [Candidatus Gastranaerophilales bacterium]